MKRFLVFVTLCLCVFAIPTCFKRYSCGFKLAKMYLEIPNNSKWDVSSLLDACEITSILSQPFIYLDRGAQSYVFASQDDKYVIKFFRYDRALTQRKGKTHASSDKVEFLFNACVLAYTKAKEETGLLFLHLNRTKDLFPSLDIRGPLGQKLNIPLDQYRFVIQKKAEPFEKALLDASKDGTMQEKIDSLLRMLKSRVDKGISNLDPSLSRNFGFLDGSAVEIDFGNYSDGVVCKENEMKRYTKRLSVWLEENDPKWVTYVESATHAYLSE